MERINVEGLEAIIKLGVKPTPLNMEAIRLEVEEIGKGPLPVCILCESGYHDAPWEVTHVMRCGCPCHREVKAA